MKVISFFSAKGGTGKTTFNMLLASYLKYVLGKSVIVIDFDAPGSMSEAEATSMILTSRLLDLAVIPTDVDGMSIASSYSLGEACRSCKTNITTSP